MSEETHVGFQFILGGVLELETILSVRAAYVSSLSS